MHSSIHCSTVYNSHTWKQPKCPFIEKWIKKIWYIYTTKYYSAIKKNKISAICSKMDGPRNYHTKRSQMKKEKYHMISLMWNLIGRRDKLGGWD